MSKEEEEGQRYRASSWAYNWDGGRSEWAVCAAATTFPWLFGQAAEMRRGARECKSAVS